MATRIGQWILSETELEKIDSLTFTVKEARQLIEVEYMPARLYAAIDLAQASVLSETTKRSFILICIE